MNQCILVGEIIDIYKRNEDIVELKLLVRQDGIQIFKVLCSNEMIKSEIFNLGDVMAVKAHLATDNEISVVAEKIGILDASEEYYFS